MNALYKDLDERFLKLDKRRTNYRFDLEIDIPWSRSAESGCHYPDDLLARFGFPIQLLAPETRVTFDWAIAVSMCELFAEFERQAIDFARNNERAIGQRPSVVALCDEEQKHIALFHRYASLLRRCEPTPGAAERLSAPLDRMLGRFAEHYAVSAKLDGAAAHYLFWAHLIFFEEMTIYLDEALRDAPDIQPLWRAIHSAHRREETQHVITDVAFLAALDLGAADRLELSTRFVLGVLIREYWGFACLTPAAELVGTTHSHQRELLPECGVTKRPFFEDILSSKLFRRTRAAIPYLGQLAQERNLSG